MNDQMMELIFLDTARLNGLKTASQIEKFRKRFFELIDFTNDQGEIIGTAPRGFAHRVGLRHFTVNVFIRDELNLLLLQQRRGGVDGEAMRLDISAAGHVKAGVKDFVGEAVRELEEELGTKVNKMNLRYITECNRNSPFNILKPYERNVERRVVFEYLVAGEEKSLLQTNFESRKNVEEVSSMAWYPMKIVADLIQTGLTADGLSGSFPQYLSHIFDEEAVK